MNFNSQICTTRSQSERLLALGLKKETADCFWLSNTSSITGKTHYRIIVGEFEEDNRCVPAWSLHRLIEIANLPQYWECISGNWYEEVIATIQSEIHIGELNKEYLED